MLVSVKVSILKLKIFVIVYISFHWNSTQCCRNCSILNQKARNMTERGCGVYKCPSDTRAVLQKTLRNNSNMQKLTLKLRGTVVRMIFWFKKATFLPYMKSMFILCLCTLFIPKDHWMFFILQVWCLPVDDTAGGCV